MVAAGEALLSPSVTQRVVSQFSRHLVEGTPSASGLDALTDREREMLAWVATGRSNQEIANELFSVPPPSAPISAAPWASWAPATVLNSWSSRSGRGSSFPRSEEIVHDRNDHPNRVPARALGVLMMLEALSFLGFALLHLGVRIAADFAVIDEPRRPFAVIVEGVAAVALALGASAVLTRRTWAWVAATGAHAIALAGVLWGMVAIAAGRGSHTQLNDTYHRVMIAVLGAGLILLLTRPGRTVLGIRKPGSDPTG